MTDKSQLPNMTVAFRIAGTNRVYSGKVTKVETDGFWIESSGFVTDIQTDVAWKLAMNDVPTPLVFFLPTASLMFLVATQV